MDENILEALSKDSVIVGAISNQLRDLVISFRNTFSLIWRNIEESDEPVPHEDSIAFVAVAQSITPNLLEAMKRLRIIWDIILNTPLWSVGLRPPYPIPPQYLRCPVGVQTEDVTEEEEESGMPSCQHPPNSSRFSGSQ
jgi:hypothetical protein